MEQENCYTCYCKLSGKIIQLKCSHRFHYNCILESYKFDELNRKCPYCRCNGGYLPLIDGILPIQNIHKEFYSYKCIQKRFCDSIIKSGCNKGMICGRRIKNNGKCGIHIKNVLE